MSEREYVENNKLLLEINIKEFSEYIQKANKVREIPYIEGKCRLPIKYSNDEYYEWRKIKYWGKLINARYAKDADMKDFLISNSKTANKPRFVKVNGQEIYNQAGGSFNRSFIRNVLHEYFKEHIKDVKPLDNINDYPLYIWMQFWINDQGKGNIDNDNKWPWEKFFNDTLTECGIIPDDNINIVNDSRKTTILIPDDENQELIIKIYGKGI